MMYKAINILVIIVGLSLLSPGANSQDNSMGNIATSVETRSIFITTNKTTSLIFPFAIKSVDRGSQDILARQVEGVGNILQIKAAVQDLQETNLTVITADGNLYSFLLNYKSNPGELVYRFSTDSTTVKDNHPENRVAMFSSKGSTDAEIILTSNRLLKTNKRVLIGVHNRRSKMNLKLRGIYIKNDVLYFQIEVKNMSSINYDVDMVQMAIRDQSRSKRTAAQEVEIKPYLISGNQSEFKADSRNVFIIATPKFTIPFAKYLTIGINEKDGGRNLRLNLSSRLIVGARLLSDH